ncbi:MAG: phytoene dehydrogenase [Thermomicrobiales bacterium]|nr:MAG: phytoene dehydrogenase [Thermomicrobiales bacterium]
MTVVEKRDQPGGRAYVYHRDGFVFDGGPTVITAPWLITDLFAVAGRRAEDALQLVPLDPFYRIIFSDNTAVDYTGHREQMHAAIRSLSAHPEDVSGYDAFVAQTERIFAKGFMELATKPFLSLRDMLVIVPDLLRLQSYRTVYGLVSRYVREERVRQMLSFHPLLIGGNPFHTTSIYALIHHLEQKWGVWYAKGGTGAIVRALVRLLEDLGGQLLLSAEATEIQTSGRRATGVALADGRILPADIVVANSDVATAYQRLLPGITRRKYTDSRLCRFRYSMSLVVIYFGTDRLYRDGPSTTIRHHTIILGPRYRGLLDDIFDHKILADDFSLYLHMPTLTDPSLAPPGCETFYVLAPVPHLGGSVDWSTAAKPFRDRIMRFLEDRFFPNLSQHIVTELMIDPRHFPRRAGQLFSEQPSPLSRYLRQSAYFRPHNRSEEVPNLYFVGAGTHPGAGLPGVLCSAIIADALITEDLSNR